MIAYSEKKFGMRCIKLDFQKQLCHICEMLNNEIFTKIKILNSLSKEFKIWKGLRQGDTILPVLFNLVLGIAVRKSKIVTTGTIFHKCIQILAYAGDLVIMGRRVQDMEETLVALTNQTKRFGIEINDQKTKFMRLFRIPYNGGENIKFGTYEFEAVSEFTYRGTLNK